MPTDVTAPVRLALVAWLPSSFCIACKIESVAATVPAPDTYPVSTLAITGAFVSVVALPTEVTSPVKLALVTTVAALPTEVTPPVRFALVVTVLALPVNAPTKLVDVTLVKPANVVELVPKVIAVLPTVTALDASFETAIAALALMSPSTIVPSAIIVLVTVPVSAEPTNVPDVGNVTVVFAVAVNVVLNAPDVTKFPPRVTVLAPLFTPVPP